jgi:hypothetical protein
MASYPIAFYVEKEPKVKPESVQELLNAIGSSIAAKFDPSVDTSALIFGQLNGILPGADVGPWSNGNSWWFWNPQKGAYVQGLDGVPIGIVMMWGGQSTPANWLVCDGSEVSRTTYQELFQVIGTTWGSGDYSTTFKLPPGGVAFINAPGFVPDPSVVLSPNVPPGMGAPVSGVTSAPYGVACIGGSQLAPLLTAANLPPMQLLVPFINAQKQQPGIAGVGLPVPYSDTSVQAYNYQVQSKEGAQLNVLAADQSQFPTMPPFATANHIIKYQ